MVSPVWFRWADGAFEVVVAEGDIKLRHLARDRRCILVVFEAVPPFRGVEVRGVPELVEGDVTAMRESIAGRYLGVEAGKRFASERRSHPGVVVRSAPLASGISPRCSRTELSSCDSGRFGRDRGHREAIRPAAPVFGSDTRGACLDGIRVRNVGACVLARP